jgi:hypothetical protein
MFPQEYFGSEYFPAAYFPKVGSAPVTTDTVQVAVVQETWTQGDIAGESWS